MAAEPASTNPSAHTWGLGGCPPLKLTPRTKAKRRVGYDFTFLIPKSICILFAITLDRRIIDLFRLAVQMTMKVIEAEAQTRVRQGGANANRVTGNLIWAEFIHTTTRPIGGVPDPLLHAHCFVFNATYDAVEKRWKAVELGDIKATASYYEAVFHSIYSHLLTQAGFALRHEGRFYEIEGIERPTIEKYSRRTLEIEREVAKRGITDPEKKAEVGAKTRRSKSESRPWSEITAEWNSRLTDDERTAILAAGKNQSPPPLEHADRDAVHALRFTGFEPPLVLAAESSRFRQRAKNSSPSTTSPRSRASRPSVILA